MLLFLLHLFLILFTTVNSSFNQKYAKNQAKSRERKKTTASVNAGDILNSIGLHNQMVRWTRLSEEFPDGVANGVLSPEKAVIHVLGGEYEEFFQYYDWIFETQREITNKQLKDSRVADVLIDFTGTFHMLPKRKIKEKMSGVQTCGSMLTQADFVPDPAMLLKFVNEQRGVPSLVEFMNGHFRSVSSVAEVKETMQEMKKMEGGVEKIVRVIQSYGEDYINSDGVFCDLDFAGFQAIVAFEDGLIGDSDCYEKLKENLKPSVAESLRVLQESLLDVELITAAVPKSLDEVDPKAIVANAISLQKQTKNFLGILSLKFVQDLLESKIDIVSSCDECDCGIKTGLSRLNRSVERLRSILKDYGTTKCETPDTSDSDFPDDPEKMDQYMMGKKSELFKDIAHLEHIDDVFEVFHTKLAKYYMQPYIGVPFSNVRTKHGLWWISSHLLARGNCEILGKIQRLAKLLEMYATKYFYVFDENYMEGCGLLSVNDPVQSMLMAGVMMNMIKYDGLRKFDFKEMIGALHQYDNGTEPNVNTFQTYSMEFFASFAFDNPASNQPQIAKHVRREGLVLDTEVTKELVNLQARCATCDMINYSKKLIDMNRVQHLNLIENRLKLKKDEVDLYHAQKDKVIARDQKLLMSCQQEREMDFRMFQKVGTLFWSSNMLKDSDVFNLVKETFVKSDSESATLASMRREFLDKQELADFDLAVQQQLRVIGQNIRTASVSILPMDVAASSKDEVFNKAFRDYLNSCRCLIMKLGVSELAENKFISPIEATCSPEVKSEKSFEIFAMQVKSGKKSGNRNLVKEKDQNLKSKVKNDSAQGDHEEKDTVKEKPIFVRNFHEKPQTKKSKKPKKVKSSKGGKANFKGGKKSKGRTKKLKNKGRQSG